MLGTKCTPQTDLWTLGPIRLSFKHKTIAGKRTEIRLLFKTERKFLRFFFHILTSIHYRSKSMPMQGTYVEVEIDLQSSLFPSWKELNYRWAFPESCSGGSPWILHWRFRCHCPCSCSALAWAVWGPSAFSFSSQGAGRGCGHFLDLSCSGAGGWVCSSLNERTSHW